MFKFFKHRMLAVFKISLQEISGDYLCVELNKTLIKYNTIINKSILGELCQKIIKLEKRLRFTKKLIIKPKPAFTNLRKIHSIFNNTIIMPRGSPTRDSEQTIRLNDEMIRPSDVSTRVSESTTRPSESFTRSNQLGIKPNRTLIRPNDKTTKPNGTLTRLSDWFTWLNAMLIRLNAIRIRVSENFTRSSGTLTNPSGTFSRPNEIKILPSKFPSLVEKENRTGSFSKDKYIIAFKRGLFPPPRSPD